MLAQRLLHFPAGFQTGGESHQVALAEGHGLAAFGGDHAFAFQDVGDLLLTPDEAGHGDFLGPGRPFADAQGVEAGLIGIVFDDDVAHDGLCLRYV